MFNREYSSNVVKVAFTCAIVSIFGGHALAQESPYPSPNGLVIRDGYTAEKPVLTEREIPVLFLYKDEYKDAKKPVVFLIHGGGMPDVMSKSSPWAKEGWFDDKYFDVPYTLADGGILVALIDHWWAGERFRPEYVDIVKKNYLASVIQGFIESAKDIPLLIDALIEVEGADPTRIGATGRSGGAIVSLMAAATDPRLTAVTSWVGAGDMKTFAYSKMPERTADHFMKRDPRIEEWLQEFDPHYQHANIAPTAVLLINNRNDPHIPFTAAESLHGQLLPAYAEIPERLKFLIRDPAEETHAMTEEDYDEGCAWLIKHLRQ